MKNTSSQARAFSRRGFLASSALGAAGIFALDPSVLGAQASLTSGDIAVLQFLAAAELIEADLWGQYSELATGNPRFRAALKTIDPALPDYINGDFEDETSHANLINAFLTAAGATPVNLDSFRTLPSVHVEGSDTSKMRLTSLTNLTIDTSYYNRYRTPSNPDFGGPAPAQEVTITNQPTIPTSDSGSVANIEAIAQTAAFHFAAIEQGGGSLYTALLPKMSDPNALAILAAIGPTEVYHFSIFQTSLEGIRPINAPNRPVFPNIRANVANGKVLPRPAPFFNTGFPLCSVIRPSSIAEAGAVAAATSLNASGLFTGNGPLVTAAVGLAQAADAATRNF
jgi:hypothetical protein